MIHYPLLKAIVTSDPPKVSRLSSLLFLILNNLRMKIISYRFLNLEKPQHPDRLHIPNPDVPPIRVATAPVSPSLPTVAYHAGVGIGAGILAWGVAC